LRGWAADGESLGPGTQYLSTDLPPRFLITSSRPNRQFPDAFLCSIISGQHGHVFSADLTGRQLSICYVSVGIVQTTVKAASTIVKEYLRTTLRVQTAAIGGVSVCVLPALANGVAPSSQNLMVSSSGLGQAAIINHAALEGRRSLLSTGCYDLILRPGNLLAQADLRAQL
jgi:hypothetical protein